VVRAARRRYTLGQREGAYSGAGDGHFQGDGACIWTHVLQGVHFVRRRYTPGSGKALAVVLAMRGGMADNIRRRMHWTDRLALNVVGGLVLPLTVAGEEQKVRFLGSRSWQTMHIHYLGVHEHFVHRHFPHLVSMTHDTPVQQPRMDSEHTEWHVMWRARNVC
jgi:hypothetical protein